MVNVVATCVVMVNVVATCAVDRGFELHSSQTKDYKIGICCFSVEYAALRGKTNAGRLGATCLAAGCCFNEPVQSKSACWSNTKRRQKYNLSRYN